MDSHSYVVVNKGYTVMKEIGLVSTRIFHTGKECAITGSLLYAIVIQRL